MPVDMVLRHVQQDRDAWMQPVMEAELERGRFNCQRRVSLFRGQRERVADVAARRGVEAGGLHHGRDHHRGGGLAVRPGHRDERHVTQPSADVQLAPDRHAPIGRPPQDLCAFRHAGAGHEGGDAIQMPGLVAARQDLHAEPADLLRPGGLRALLGHPDLGSFLSKDPCGGAAGDAEPHDQHALADERLRPLHRPRRPSSLIPCPPVQGSPRRTARCRWPRTSRR